MAKVRHKLIDGRPSRWGPGKTHLVGDGPKSPLDEPPTLCGKYVSGGQHTGTLDDVDCKRCVASLARQMEQVK